MDENRQTEFVLYSALVFIRILLAVAPQTGYIHPDEYFQSLEVVLGDVYQIKRSKIWEFDDEFPIRNAFIPYVLYGVPCYIMKVFLQVFKLYGPVSPYSLVIPPRIVMCILSFLVDFSLVRICRLYRTDVSGRLVLLASSCVMLVFASRTFSNTVEMILFSLLLYVVTKNIIASEKVYPLEDRLKAALEDTTTNPRNRVLILRQLKRISHHNRSGFWQISVLTCLGIFNRPTFVPYSIGPIFFWLYRGAPLRKISFYTIQLRFAWLLSVGVPLSALLVLGDTIYYKRETSLEMLTTYGLGTCLNRFIECFEFTPLNFLRYNLYIENLAEHGLHPRYLHILVNIPLLYNVLGVSVLFMIFSVFFRILQRRIFNLPKFDSITGLMFGSIIIPLAVLSLAPHQEPRFLIPLTLPMIFLKGMKMNNKIEDKEYSFKSLFGGKIANVMFCVWCFCNLVVVLFFGFIHQSGVLPSMNYITSIRQELKDETRIHVVPSYTYTLPQTLLTATIYDGKTWRASQSNVIVYPTTSSNFDTSMKLLETVIQSVERSPPHDDLVYFLFPTYLTSNFTSHRILKRLNVTYILEYYYLAHISTEALPKPSELVSKIGLNVVLLRSEKFLRYDQEDTFLEYFSPKDNPSIDQLFSNFYK